MARFEGIPKVTFLDFVKRAREIVKNPLPFHHDNFENKGETFLLHLGFGKRILFSRDAAFLKYVLQTHQRNYTKSEVQTKDVAKYLGKGLLTSEGELWKRQRRLIQPTFHKKYLNELLEGMRQTIRDELSKIPSEKYINVEPYFGHLAFKVVAKSLFSGEVDDQTISRLQTIVEASQKMLVRELRQPYLVWWFKISGLLGKHFAMVKESRQLIRQLIAERKASSSRKGDLLDLLIEAKYEDGSSMEEEQMIDEILILFTAGHETTSNALTFTCQLLAKHPEYQIRLRQESLGLDSQGLMPAIMAQKMTKQVIEESMRLYPPAYFIDRMNFKADEFEGMCFPANTPVLFSVIEIHRGEKFWEAPLKFRPERFEGQPKKTSDFYFPFGAGPRMCIGNNFAMFEMQLVISELMQNFKITGNDRPIEILPLITLKPKNAILKFEKIRGAQ